GPVSATCKPKNMLILVAISLDHPTKDSNSEFWSTIICQTLCLHDALPIFDRAGRCVTPMTADNRDPSGSRRSSCGFAVSNGRLRSEEHTSELQSRENLVCRLLLEKKKRTKTQIRNYVSRLHAKHFECEDLF